MKTISAPSAALLDASHQEIFYLVEIDWPVSGTRRYAQRAIAIEGVAYAPRLVRVEDFSTAVEGGALDPLRQRDSLVIHLGDDPDAPDESAARLIEQNGAAGYRVRLHAVPRDRDASPPVMSDRVSLQTFVTSRADVVPGAVVIHAVGLRSAMASRPLCRVVSRGDFPGATPDALGRVVPVLFGALRRVPLTPWRVGVPRALAADVAPDDGVIPLTDVAGLPPAGQVQLGAEVIAYRAIDSAARTLGTSASPATRTAPAAHDAGDSVWLIPPDGFAFLLADHVCKSIGAIQAGELPLPPASYSIQALKHNGRSMTAVFFPRLPVVRRHSPAPRILAVNNSIIPGALAIAPESLALFEPLALDNKGDDTAAHLTPVFSSLRVLVQADWRDGASRFGALRNVIVHVDYAIKGHWTSGTRGTLMAEWGGAALSLDLPVAPAETRESPLPAHSHALPDSTLESPASPAPGPAIATVTFDSVSGEMTHEDGSRSWPDAARVMDGSLDAPAESFAGEGRSFDFTPLRLRRLRPFFGPGQRLVRLVFKARVAAPDAEAESAPRRVVMAAYVQGAFLGHRVANATPVPAVIETDIPVSLLTAEALASPETFFQLAEQNGALIQVYEAWLEAHTEPRIEAAAGPSSGVPRETQPSAGAAIILPHRGSAAMSLAELLPRGDDGEFDETGWSLFDPANPPRITVTLDAPAGSEAFLYVFNVAMEIEYAPLLSERVVSDELFADVEGVADDVSGALIENPADILEWLIRDGTALSLPAFALDAASFAAARAALAALEYRFAGMIRDRDSIGDIMDRLAWEARSALYFSGERFSLRILERWAPPGAVATALDESRILPKRSLRIAAGDGLSALDVSFGPAPESGNRRFDESLNVGAVSDSSLPSRRVELKWHPASGREAAGDWAAFTLARAGDEPRRLLVQSPLSALRREPLEHLTASDAALNLAAAPGTLMSLGLDSLARVALGIALDPAVETCWANAAAAMHRLPGRFELLFVIGGRAVATLDAQGRVRLRGEAREQSYPPASGPGPLTWADVPLAWDAAHEHLVFGHGVASPFTPAFALDADGNLLVPGGIAEFSPPLEPPPAPNGCVSSAEGVVSLSPGIGAPAMWFLIPENTLFLRGEVSEETPVF